MKKNVKKIVGYSEVDAFHWDTETMQPTLVLGRLKVGNKRNPDDKFRITVLTEPLKKRGKR